MLSVPVLVMCMSDSFSSICAATLSQLLAISLASPIPVGQPRLSHGFKVPKFSLIGQRQAPNRLETKSINQSVWVPHTLGMHRHD